ncbi:helix-turn-helix domain-containing protein [Hymenobacter sp. HSC-4F20]|uniref:helix-turn-helix transcriptional regulator n=1 Tax=Hymenobacter sp. HSC-4F20 TaxID=2864135 RepID=UPI001C733069|nr:helix-turn-helix transcriptional regulator [Hymenobacter sp. HSC-4F20]MBX0289972.1 helix-turn-helix domain-containing protein [Hymenobacter sp. HSC-4F20]
MPRPSTPSTTLPARIRKYFGLEQQELAAFLGISRQLLAHIEAGRRTLTGPVLRRLTPLAALLPPEAAPVAPEAEPVGEPPPAPPAPGPLEARHDTCRHQAGKLCQELRALEGALALARRWEQALPELLAAAPPPDGAALASPPDKATRQWLLRRQQQSQALLHDADLAARYQLLRLRVAALEAEAAGLEELLGPGQLKG